MIVDLPSTTSSAINRKLVDIRERGGTVTLSRVLTLVIVTEDDGSEAPIEAANAASFEHPCRVIVVARGTRRGAARLDGQIRVGGDAGASEVIVLRLFGPLADHGASVVVPLLLADSPVVAWWPSTAPEVPADDPIGALASRRITDAAAARRPGAELLKRPAAYRPGDTDLAWTRLTMWRGLLAAALDQPPHEKVTSVTVRGASDSASTDLLAAWLALRLHCPVHRQVTGKPGTGMRSVELDRRSGQISLVRPETITATLTVTNQPERTLALPRRPLRDCLAEELRRLDFDEVYSEVLDKGLPLVTHSRAAAAKPAAKAAAPPNKAGARKASSTATPTTSAATRGASPKTTSPKAARPSRARKRATS